MLVLLSLTDIIKYFVRNYHRGNSNQEEGAKKLKGTLNTSRENDIPNKAFNQSLKSPHCGRK